MSDSPDHGCRRLWWQVAPSPPVVSPPAVILISGPHSMRARRRDGGQRCTRRGGRFTPRIAKHKDRTLDFSETWRYRPEMTLELRNRIPTERSDVHTPQSVFTIKGTSGSPGHQGSRHFENPQQTGDDCLMQRATTRTNTSVTRHSSRITCQHPRYLDPEGLWVETPLHEGGLVVSGGPGRYLAPISPI